MTTRRLAPLLFLPLTLVACGDPTAPTTAAPPTAAPTTAAPVVPVATARRVPRAEIRGTSAGGWTLRVTYPNGDVMTGQVQADPDVRPDVLGVVDADRDGDHEVFVRTGGGASTTTYNVFTPVEDGMAEVRDGNGRSIRLVVGGGVMHGDGFRCDRGALTVLSVVSDDGESFRGTAVTHTWRDDRATETSRRSFTGRSGDPQVRAAYGIDCAGLSRKG